MMRGVGILRRGKVSGNYSFFQNRKCEFFPCHSCGDDSSFNCLFCYCPLYFTDCPGNFSYTADGIKDCSRCLLPHRKENYGLIIKILNKEIKNRRK